MVKNTGYIFIQCLHLAHWAVLQWLQRHGSALFARTGTLMVREARERHQLYCSIYDPQVKTDYVWLDRWWLVWPTICCILIAVSLGKGFHGNKPWVPLICCFAALTHLEAGWIPFCQAHILLLYFLTELSLTLSLSKSLSLTICCLSLSLFLTLSHSYSLSLSCLFSLSPSPSLALSLICSHSPSPFLAIYLNVVFFYYICILYVMLR